MSGPRLIGDIGGTNARFAIALNGRFDHLRVLHTADHASLLDAIRVYLSGIPADLTPTEAFMDIAGPVTGDHLHLTNQNWSFSVSQMKADLGLSEMVVMNDFAATAMAVPYLQEADRLQIGPGNTAARGPIALIGPGTGLGVGSLVPVAGGWMQLPGEGGHVTMCAASEEESRILDVLRPQFDHVSAERLLSGQGLVNLYGAICTLRGLTGPALHANEITEGALAGHDPAAAQAIDLFCAMLGTVAGNLALTLGATGGVYVAGGIPPRFKDRFATSAFRERFESKGRMRPYLAPIPTYLILHPETALLGLASHGLPPRIAA
jgi:glucokinase